MSEFQKGLAYPWIRIVLYIVLCILISYISHLLKIKLGQNIEFVLVLLLPALLIESLRKSGKFYLIGLRIDKFFIRDLLFALLIVAVSFSCIIILALLIGANHNFTGQFEFNQKLFNTLAFFFFAACIEELLFRGLIFQSLIEKYSATTVTILISSLFALAHIKNPSATVFSAINVFLAGVVISFMYIKTKSLWLPIFFHFFWNISQILLLGSPVSGWTQYSNLYFYKIDLLSINVKYRFFLGAGFGIEEGLITTILLLSYIYIVAKYGKPSPYISAELFKQRIAESELLFKTKILN